MTRACNKGNAGSKPAQLASDLTGPINSDKTDFDFWRSILYFGGRNPYTVQSPGNSELSFGKLHGLARTYVQR